MIAYLPFIFILMSSCELQQKGPSDPQPPANVIKVGMVLGPEAELLVKAKEVFEKDKKQRLALTSFNDTLSLNHALEEGDIDAHISQSAVFLDYSNKINNFHITAHGKIFFSPLSAYSKAISHFSKIPAGSSVAIPNEPLEASRAIALLAESQLIEINPSSSPHGSPYKLTDIRKNPKNLKIMLTDIYKLPEMLDRIEVVIITKVLARATAIDQNFKLAEESHPEQYANLLVVHEKNKSQEWVKQLKQALKSQEIQDEATKIFGSTLFFTAATI